MMSRPLWLYRIKAFLRMEGEDKPTHYLRSGAEAQITENILATDAEDAIEAYRHRRTNVVRILEVALAYNESVAFVSADASAIGLRADRT